ncbi:MAG: hypothetical protein A2X36_06595 [Elusimicrobia bacterium GWA2_69_24]|nr:MAG: hypothetical protein A2X36_06595 [Elusimicrobia bacterium GWA2_69_24]HBL17962.1 hypothetical protein [Elusimicrobiota bacterium]
MLEWGLPAWRRPLRALLALAWLGCGANLDFKQARHLEDAGDKMRAVAAFERFLERRPADPRVPEASFRLGRLHAEVLGRCPEAVRYFEAAARAEGPWAEPSRLGLMTCPDFFPLQPRSRWTYVDTESGGKNMRLEIAVKASSGAAGAEVSGAFFAGAKRFMDYRRRYSRSEWSVWESEGDAPDRAPILRFPFRAGRSWEIRRGKQKVRYDIAADGLTVRTKAGSFPDCLKVKAHTEGYASWVYEYFCPGVGRVKTTVGVPGSENPNTELAAFSVSPG